MNFFSAILEVGQAVVGHINNSITSLFNVIGFLENAGTFLLGLLAELPQEITLVAVCVYTISMIYLIVGR